MTIEFNHLPVIPLRITSKFGKRNTGISGASTNHKGIDLGRDWTRTETTVHSVKKGIVVKNYWNDYRGWVIVIQHDGFQTLYQHLKAQSPLKVGTEVYAGQEIGVMGNTSNPAKLSISMHLHFELLINDTPIDPEPYLLNIKEEVDMTEKEVTNLVKNLINEIVYPQGGEPSDWAKKAWEEAKEKGITDGSNPKATLTREQAITMIYRAKQGE